VYFLMYFYQGKTSWPDARSFPSRRNRRNQFTTELEMSSTNEELIEPKDLTGSRNTKEPVELKTLTGSRYTIDVLTPLLEEVIVVKQGKVTAEVADEVKKLLDGKQSKQLELRDGTSARLMTINSADGLRISPLRVEAKLELRSEILGYQLSDNDRYLLERHGHLGRAVTLNGPDGKPFKGLIGLNHQDNTMNVLAVDKLDLPDKIAGVIISRADKIQLLAGLSVQKKDFVSRKAAEGRPGETFAGFVRLDPAKAKTQLFHFERIVPGPVIPQRRSQQSRQQTGEAGQKIISASATPIRGEESTALIDRLGLKEGGKEGIQKGILKFDNGTTALVIVPPVVGKLVVKIALPEPHNTESAGRMFELPVLLPKREAETLVQLAHKLDRAIGQKNPLGPILSELPEGIREVLPVVKHHVDAGKASPPKGTVEPVKEPANKTLKATTSAPTKRKLKP